MDRALQWRAESGITAAPAVATRAPDDAGRGLGRTEDPVVDTIAERFSDTVHDAATARTAT